MCGPAPIAGCRRRVLRDAELLVADLLYWWCPVVRTAGVVWRTRRITATNGGPRHDATSGEFLPRRRRAARVGRKASRWAAPRCVAASTRRIRPRSSESDPGHHGPRPGRSGDDFDLHFLGAARTRTRRNPPAVVQRANSNPFIAPSRLRMFHVQFMSLLLPGVEQQVGQGLVSATSVSRIATSSAVPCLEKHDPVDRAQLQVWDWPFR